MVTPSPISDDRTADPLGHGLLSRRLAQLPQWLHDMAAHPLRDVSAPARAGQSFLVTGTGSSEAHARFLVHLLNRHARRAAEFIPLSAFCAVPAGFGRGRVLVVVSQGISPNAQVAIDRYSEFEHAIIFTATTAEGAARAGKPERAEMIRRLESAGVELVRAPLEEEYSTLLRVVGPLAAYLSVHQFVRCLAPTLPPIDPPALAPLLATPCPPDVIERFAAHVEDFRRGFYLLAAAPLCEFAHNLAYKFLEGLYWSAPVIWDYLQFAHGPFQEVTLQPRPVVLLKGPAGTERELARRTRRMLDAAGVPCIEISTTAPTPDSIFEYETVFNQLVFALIRRCGIDQRHWPSKGKDDPLYGFYRLE